MAPDFFETDRTVSDTDAAGPLEAVIGEQPPTVRRRAMRSLFQMVCLQREPEVPAAAPRP